MTFEEAFLKLYSTKKNSLIAVFCFYSLFGLLLFSKIDFPLYAKIVCFLCFGFAIFVDGILALKEFRHFWKLSHEFCDTLEEREKALKHIKDIVDGADPEKLGDSILLTNHGLLETVRDSGMSGAFKRFEVNGEYDAIMLLKRKSLPLDEVIEILHKSNHL